MAVQNVTDASLNGRIVRGSRWEMPTVEFICRTLAEWFEEPCNYAFGGIEAKDRIDDDEWCEEHCGNIAEWECWKKLFEAEAKRCDVNLFQNGNS